jgi:hypothetical protein
MNTTLNTAAADIDTLGAILANIAALEKRAEEIKKALKDEASLSGQQHFDGAIFRATYIESNRSTVDWKAIAKIANIPADLIAKHTKSNAVYSRQGHHPLIPPLP